MAINNILKSIVLDVYDHDNKTPKTIKAIAADNDVRYIAAEIQSEGVRYDVSASSTVELIILRPDKVGVSIVGQPQEFTYQSPDIFDTDTGETTPGETITYYGVYAELDQVALAKTGILLGQFKITNGEQVLRTELFRVNNGRALDTETSDWAGEYQGYNLDELVRSVNGMETDVSGLKDGFSAMSTATSSDVGKALKAKTVTNGKVTDWEFGEAGGADPDAIGQAVEDWLDAHPEATTTVPDKSLTINKMATGTLGYVTPEMYGAVGDGTTDDTSAFSQACNSGKPVVLTQGKTYKIDTVTVASPLIIIGNFATVSTTSSDSVKNTITVRENAKTVVIGDVNFTTALGINTTGAHGEAIPNRSLRTCIASYGVEKLSVINCNFENFDNGIIGITQSADMVYASVPHHLYVKDTKITNCLMGISRHYKNAVIDGCYIQVDANAQSGEHCIYLLSDVLSDVYIANTTLVTDGSSAGACVNIRPRTGEAGANLVDGVYRIDGCTIIGDGYVHIHGGGKCYVTSCTLKTVNYNTTAKMRQFACPSTDDSVIDVSGCSINLELQDGLTERVIYRGCDIYSGRVFNTRFALFKAYNCQFDNIGINVAEGAEIVGCVFSSTSGVAGKYYVLVGSTITASTIIGCTFKTGTDVNTIAYNSSGICLLVAVISSLPNGNNITGLTFHHKIDPAQSGDGSTDTGMSIVNGQLCVTYAE